MAEGTLHPAASAAIYPSLAGKRVIVSGGASGIGEGIVEAFVRQGSAVAFLDVLEQESEALVQRFAEAAIPPLFVQCDIRNCDDYAAKVRKLIERLGGCEVLINNAANDDRHSLEDVTSEYWDERMAVNLKHQFFAAQAAIPAMRAAGGGSIVNLGSISWHLGLPDLTLYQIAKAAIEGLTRSLAREVGRDGIRVNTILPGNVQTPRQMKWYTPEGEAEIVAQQCLDGRIQPSDIASMALFLASDDSRFCTAHNYWVDAGVEIAAQVRSVLQADSKLGEGVLWDAPRGVVWFVDIKQHRLWHYDPETGSNAMAEAPGQIGWALPAEGGLLLCGLKDGLYTFDPATQAFARLMAVPGEPAGNRLNDACTDPWGRVWFGSMDDAEEAKSGRFYVFDRGEIRPAGPSGISITNGPAVSGSGDRIYFTDTLGQKIMVADLTANGVGEARPFADTGALFPEAYPDGPIVDAEDHLWTGLYLGARVARFSPDGKLVATVTMPARDITKMALGGADLKTAYVTTATKNMDEAAFKEFPAAGSLLSFASPVAGVAPARVKLG